MSYYVPLTARGHVEEAKRHLRTASRILHEEGKTKRNIKVLSCITQISAALRGWQESSTRPL